MAKIRLTDDRVLVIPKEAKEFTEGGLALPETSQEKPQLGRVKEVGPGHMLENGERVPVGVEPGQIIYFAKYSGAEIKLEGDPQTYLLIRGDDILAIIDES
jgi:chaperonin GroES